MIFFKIIWESRINMKLDYSFGNKNNKNYYFVTLNNRGLSDEIVSDLFNVSLEEYVDILKAMGAIEEDSRGYIFNTVEEVTSAIVTLKMFLNEP